MLEFLVLAIGVDWLSPNSILRMLFAYSLELHKTSLIHVIIVMFYLLFAWIKLCGKLLIFPTPSTRCVMLASVQGNLRAVEEL